MLRVVKRPRLAGVPSVAHREVRVRVASNQEVDKYVFTITDNSNLAQLIGERYIQCMAYALAYMLRTPSIGCCRLKL